MSIAGLQRVKSYIETDLKEWEGRGGRDSRCVAQGLRIALSAVTGVLNKELADAGQATGHEETVRRGLMAKREAQLLEALQGGQTYEDGGEEDEDVLALGRPRARKAHQ